MPRLAPDTKYTLVSDIWSAWDDEDNWSRRQLVTRGLSTEATTWGQPSATYAAILCYKTFAGGELKELESPSEFTIFEPEHSD
jgi:hypothetical protein